MSVSAEAVVVEPMTRADLSAVMAMDDLCFAETWSAAVWRAEMRTASRCHLVARIPADHASAGEADAHGKGDPARSGSAGRPGTVIGHAGVLLEAGTAQVITVAVHPERRGEGIATALLAQLLDRARRAGACAAALEVRASARDVQRLYGRFGFSPVAVKRGYYARPSEDALVMWLADLPAAGSAASQPVPSGPAALDAGCAVAGHVQGAVS